ncbi:MAG: hypothetical protein F6K31_28540 [Symploca sp. SIO2G7]|nr:hypothetical protein [Symploca sp. SIO2G7]
MLKPSNLITVACSLFPVASFHKSVFDLVQDLSLEPWNLLDEELRNGKLWSLGKIYLESLMVNFFIGIALEPFGTSLKETGSK